MFKNSIIVIPNISSEDQVCDFLLQTAKILAKNNLVFVPTFSVDSRNYELDGVHFLKFWQILPLKRLAIINDLNRLIYFFFLQCYLKIRYLNYKKHYIWIFFPEFADFLKVKLFFFKAIFDIVDFHFSPIKEKQKIIKDQKKLLLKNADYVFSISKSLKKLYQQYRETEIKIVPQGFALQDFSIKNKETKLNLPIDKPLVGFIGQMSERLDLKLLYDLVKNNHQWNFVFIGPKHHEPNVSRKIYKAEIDEIFSEENVFYFDKQPKDTISSIINKFDICIIPYDVSFEFNFYSYPMKTFEYFYLGKPVVSSKIKELENFKGLLETAESPEEWQEKIEKLLEIRWPKNKKILQKKLAIQNSWQNKLEIISNYL